MEKVQITLVGLAPALDDTDSPEIVFIAFKALINVFKQSAGFDQPKHCVTPQCRTPVDNGDALGLASV